MEIKDARFIVSNTDVKKCPLPNKPEYAFIGRSNVGKSSLIKRLTNKKAFEKGMNKILAIVKMNTRVVIWVSWYKKSSRMATDITEDIIRTYALHNNLVDVKVCAVSELWSGLKLVVPVAKR